MIRAVFALLPHGSTRRVAWHLVLATSGVLLRAVSTVLLVPLIAALFSGEPLKAWPWMGVLAATTAAGWCIDWAAARVAYQLGFSILEHGQCTLADRIISIRLTWFNSANTSTTRQAIAATGPDLVGVFVYFLTPLIGAILLPLTIALVLMSVHWILGVAALAGIIVLLGAFWLAGRLQRNADQAVHAAHDALTERVLEFARTQQALRAARRVEPAQSQAGAALATTHRATMRSLLMQIPGQTLFSVASQCALVVLAGTTVALTAEQTLSTPQAIALIVVIVRYLESFTIFAELSPGVEAVTTTMRRIKRVLDAPEEPHGDISFTTHRAPSVELDQIRFTYHAGAPTEPAVFEAFDLRLRPGSTTAIVGPSGSGKSTLLALIAGLYQPQAGAIRIDGHNISDLDIASRRRLISMIFQDPYLFDGSVRDNIVAGAPDASEAEILAAGRLARIDQLVDHLPASWDSRVGEAGGNLSGGERQRISIARALIKPAPILLVDEATSALDSENESAVAAALTQDRVPRTRVIVAHRLSSIRAADRVVFLDRGRIVEDGTIDELLATGGRFADFWHQQNSASAWHLR